VDGSLDFQIAPAVAELIEQPNALAEKHRDEVDLHFVEEPGLDALLDEARAAGHRDVFVSGCLASLGERGLEAVRDEDNDVPPCFATVSRAWWVRTNTGTRNGGSSAHHPSATGSSSHGRLRRR
jgi:hypothetical protein